MQTRLLVLAIWVLPVLFTGCSRLDPEGAPTAATALPAATSVPEGSAQTGDEMGTPTAAPLQPTATAETQEVEDAPGFLQRPEGALRALSFNPYWDAIFAEPLLRDGPIPHYDKAVAFRRVLAATAPDVACLQEVSPARDAGQLAAIFNDTLPGDGDNGWAVHQGQDTAIVSRYPLSLLGNVRVFSAATYSLGHAMALVDLPDAQYAHDLYVVCAHFKSGGGDGNIAQRQEHADRIAAWLADARSSGGEIDLPAGTALLVLGDFNVYDTDPAYHLQTLLHGDIVGEARFGPDSAPDWDGTALADALPTHNAAGAETYTWRDDTQQFNPGALDRILYSDSVLALAHAFVLNTVALAPAELAAANLEAADVVLDLEQGHYDHLPLVADFYMIQD